MIRATLVNTQTDRDSFWPVVFNCCSIVTFGVSQN